MRPNFFGSGGGSDTCEAITKSWGLNDLLGENRCRKFMVHKLVLMSN